MYVPVLYSQVKAGLAHATRLRDAQPKDHHDAKARGNECYKEGKYEEARVWYNKGLAMCDASGEPEFVATLLTNRAECNRQMCEIKEVVGEREREREQHNRISTTHARTSHTVTPRTLYSYDINTP